MADNEQAVTLDLAALFNPDLSEIKITVKVLEPREPADDNAPPFYESEMLLCPHDVQFAELMTVESNTGCGRDRLALFKPGQLPAHLDGVLVLKGKGAFMQNATASRFHNLPSSIATVGEENPDQSLRGKTLFILEMPSNIEALTQQALVERAKLVNIALKGAFNFPNLDMHSLLSEALKGGEIEIRLPK